MNYTAMNFHIFRQVLSLSILVSFRVIGKSGLMFEFGTGLLKTVKFLPALTEDVTSSFFVMADN